MVNEQPNIIKGRSLLIKCLVWTGVILLLGGGLTWLLNKPKTIIDELPLLQLEQLSGDPVQLNTFIGHPVVLNLWATWCAPCRRELPMMTTYDKQNPGVTFLFVNQKESATQITQFLETQHLSLKHNLLDKRGSLPNIFHSLGLPTTLFFNADGKLIKTQIGEISSLDLFNTLVDLQR